MVQVLHHVSLRIVKKIIESCSSQQWVLSLRSDSYVPLRYLAKPPSRPNERLKSSPWLLWEDIFDKHNLLKLEVTQLPAYQYYPTTLTSGNGMRKARKRWKKSRDVGIISIREEWFHIANWKLLHGRKRQYGVTFTKLFNNIEKLIFWSSMKNLDVSISSTTSPNANGRTVANLTVDDGPPGVVWTPHATLR